MKIRIVLYLPSQASQLRSTICMSSLSSCANQTLRLFASFGSFLRFSTEISWDLRKNLEKSICLGKNELESFFPCLFWIKIVIFAVLQHEMWAKHSVAFWSRDTVSLISSRRPRAAYVRATVSIFSIASSHPFPSIHRVALASIGSRSQCWLATLLDRLFSLHRPCQYHLSSSLNLYTRRYMFWHGVMLMAFLRTFWTGN